MKGMLVFENIRDRDARGGYRVRTTQARLRKLMSEADWAKNESMAFVLSLLAESRGLLRCRALVKRLDFSTWVVSDLLSCVPMISAPLELSVTSDFE